MRRRLLILVLLPPLACGDGTSGEPPRGSRDRPATAAPQAFCFVDATPESGVRFRHDAAMTGEYLLPEIMGGGGGFLDCDGDGLLDICLVDTGPVYGEATARRARLWRNLGGFRFREVTDEAGLGGRGPGMGLATGDMDNDGSVDLLVTGVAGNILYRNRGDGTFADVTTAAGVTGVGWSTSAAFLDVDADGLLDLFIGRYVDVSDPAAVRRKVCFALTGARDYCAPGVYEAPLPSLLYRNRGAGRFDDASAESGIASKAGTALGVVAADLDGDDRIDIYVSNDQMFSFAWMNRGDGTFEESALTRGAAVDDMGRVQAGMGVVAVDIDDDGDMDLWKVHLYREAAILYRNARGRFDEATGELGLAAPTRLRTGFGTAVFDADLDGLLDIFVANGRVQLVPDLVAAADVYAERNQCLRQVRPGRFEDVTDASGPGLAPVENSRAAAAGDVDNDGDLDLLVVNCHGEARLLRNDTPRRGGFLMIRVLDRHGRDALGARVTIRLGARTVTAEVRTASSYLAAGDPRVHVGLGSAAGASEILVRWPGGAVETFEGAPAGSFPVLREGRGRR